MNLKYILFRGFHYEGLVILILALIPLTVIKANNGLEVTKEHGQDYTSAISSISNNANNSYSIAPIVKQNSHSENLGYFSVLESIDTVFCEPLNINLMVKNYQGNTNDTIFACVYEEITIYASYNGNRELMYNWLDGSASPELTLTTTGVGIDIQKIWLELTDPQTGCMYTDTLIVIYNFASCVGVGEKEDEWPVRLFPNPTKDVLFLEYSDIQGPIRLIISNISGQVVYEESMRNDHPGINQIQLNLQFLPKGLYLLKLISGQKYQIEKILLD
jgi:hypothetical protein